jgi:hypothetical protein
MNEKALFVLVSIMEDALMDFWTFRAKDELEVAQHLLQHSWKYEDLFRAIRISLKEVDELSPDTLLQAIDGSPFRPRRFVISRKLVWQRETIVMILRSAALRPAAGMVTSS